MTEAGSELFPISVAVTPNVGAKCHPHKPIYCRSLCRACYDRGRFERRPELRENIRAKLKVYRDTLYKTRRVELRAERHKAYADDGKAYRRSLNLRSKYHLSSADYDKLSAAQSGHCAICCEPPRGIEKNGLSSKFLCVDHDARTGAIRGLLCRSCNSGLGQFRDVPRFLRRAADYLERSSG